MKARTGFGSSDREAIRKPLTLILHHHPMFWLLGEDGFKI